MFSKLIVFAVALAAASAAVAPDYAKETEIDLRNFIHRCSYSADDINSCFVKQGNIAIRELAEGLEDLGIVRLNGSDIGDVFFSLENDLSFLFENVKLYAEKPKLEKAKLTFDEKGVFTNVRITYSFTDYYWEGEYRGIGYFNNTKINEKGRFRINFGSFYGNYTAQLKQKEIDGEIYLKIRQHSGSKNYEKFEFLPSNVITKGHPLQAAQFQEVQQAVIDKVIETRQEYVTFVFNQILLEIPQGDLFLP